MKILITGGAGFIGSNLALALQEKFPQDDLIVIDDFSVGNFNNLLDFRGEVITADLTDFNWDSLGNIDYIFHQAAITDTTIIDQKKMMQVNVGVFKNIVDFCLNKGVKLVYASSAATYGHSKPPMLEGENEVPANVYGFSKKICDNIAIKTMKEHPHFHIVGLKYFNVYGPRESYKGKMASMIWQTYLQIKSGNKPKIFKYGKQKRDFVYVKDVIRANILAMDGPSGIFNVGTGKAEDFNRIIFELSKNMGLDIKPKYIDNPFIFYQEFTEANLNNAQRWNYLPEYNLEKGIKDYLEWINNNHL